MGQLRHWRRTGLATPTEILDAALRLASDSLAQIIAETDIVEAVDYVCRANTRAGVRFLMACLLAKTHDPGKDIRKPYSEQLGTSDSYSGRHYDERYIQPFVVEHDLPCNRTTSFLTPAFRGGNAVLSLDIEIVGRPKLLYRKVLELLHAIYTEQISSDKLLAQIVRCLIQLRDERSQRIASLLTELRASRDDTSLSAESIVLLISQHLALPRASRLPVLIVAAAYQSAAEHLGEQVMPLEAHNAADEQTGALGDLQITLLNDNNVMTCYEMKMRRVTIHDLNQVLFKLHNRSNKVEHYVIITTDKIESEVVDYATTLYSSTGGTEIVVLDCIQFLRHFLHLFHRLRSKFLDTYQTLVLAEPTSAVDQPLKEAFLALRRAAEAQ